MVLLLGIVGWAELSLVAFAFLPGPAGAIPLFMNGLALGMVWGLVVRYLEGRRVSDILLAALCASFILASGVTKDAGRWLMDAGVAEMWMPAATGLLFLPVFVASVWFLDRIPEPDARDIVERSERVEMHARERGAFLRAHYPGLVPLFLVYLFLTAYRDYRDNYGVEMLDKLGLGESAGVFTRMETPVAFVVVGSLGLFYTIRDSRRALRAVFAMMIAGMAIVAASTFAFRAGLLGGISWLTLAGVGAYLTYVPYNAVLFERLMAATRSVGTAVFAISVADALGYTGSVGVQIYRDILRAESSRLEFFESFSLMLGVAGVVGLAAGGRYFLKKSAKIEEEEPT